MEQRCIGYGDDIASGLDVVVVDKRLCHLRIVLCDRLRVWSSAHYNLLEGQDDMVVPPIRYPC